MDNLLNRALDEAPPRHDEAPPSDVADLRTRDVHALGGTLHLLRTQLLDTMASPFFDAGSHAEFVPVVKHGTAEVGCVKVTSRRRKPAYDVTASIEVRCDHDTIGAAGPDSGRYQVRAKLAVACADERGRTLREFVFAVHEVDGDLLLDRADLEQKMAAAIRSIGKPG